MGYLDPTATRLSDSLLLSDVMGCDSIYRYGYQNRFDDVDQAKIEEGYKLANLLEQLQESYGPYSVCYGYISRDLSKKIVTYQDPVKPSYHMWDLGAAVDICFHELVDVEAPIKTAHDIDEYYDYSRLITYSESEWLCIGTRLEEKSGESRKKLYENRYIGTKKPKWVQYSQNSGTRAEQKCNLVLEHDWKGTGHPQYHGGGRNQFEHQRVSKYTHISDFLYDKYKVHKGVANMPPLTNRRIMKAWRECARQAGHALDSILEETGARLSIVRAYNSSDPYMDWSKRFTLEVVVPTFHSTEDIAHYFTLLNHVAKVSITKHKEPRIQITGEYL